ncbi:MAG TPA: tripartite tricarboxylate transporter TctB family protein [Usitatibacter sp.]|nr:tripartite tricarboxylate transporter TctB family protein [Usitatibacter sp.]
MNGKLRASAPYAALLAGAVFLYHRAERFSHLGRPGQLGPDFWPKAVLVLLMAVCAIEIARRLLSAPAPGGAAQAKEGSMARSAAQHEEEPRYPRLLAGGIALSVLYVWGLELIGFFLCTALFLAAFMLVGRYRRAGVIAATSVLGSLAFVFVFMKVVYVSLPLGVGPFLELSAALLRALGIH